MTDTHYYKQDRAHILDHIPMDLGSVLDLGCASGGFGALLKNSEMASKVVGIEMDAKASCEAREVLDKVICANIRTKTIKDLLIENEESQFDTIFCNDILEHVTDPDVVLRECKAVLAPGGKLITSIPNVQHLSVSLPLLFGGYRFRNSRSHSH